MRFFRSAFFPLLVIVFVAFVVSECTRPNDARAHMPNTTKPYVKLHHAATALLWLEKNRGAFRWNKRGYKIAVRDHEWLFFNTFDRMGYYDPFMCIHYKERDPRQGWQTNTGNGFYGGLQMDWSFQTTYGPEYFSLWGSANNWPVWAQLHAGYRAVISGRGFGPWPNTRKGCA